VWPLLYLWRLLKEQQVQVQFESHWTGAFKLWACAQLGLVPLTSRGAVGWVIRSFPSLKAPLKRFLLPPLATAAVRRAEPPEAPTHKAKVQLRNLRPNKKKRHQREKHLENNSVQVRRLCASELAVK